MTNVTISTGGVSAAAASNPSLSMWQRALLAICCASRSANSGSSSTTLNSITGPNGGGTASGSIQQCTSTTCAAYGYRGRRLHEEARPVEAVAANAPRALGAIGGDGRIYLDVSFVIPPSQGGAQEGWRISDRFTAMKTDPARLQVCIVESAYVLNEDKP